MNRFFATIVAGPFRRRWPRLIAGASVASASVLMFIILIFLITSYFEQDRLYLNHPWRWHTVRLIMSSCKGQLMFHADLPIYPFPWQRDGMEEGNLRQFIAWEQDQGGIFAFSSVKPLSEYWEISWKYDHWGPSPSGFYIVVNMPHVLPLAVLGTFIILFFIWRAAARRLAAGFGNGHCERCGYDLRATPTRCPECGATNLQAKKIE